MKQNQEIKTPQNDKTNEKRKEMSKIFIVEDENIADDVRVSGGAGLRDWWARKLWLRVKFGLWKKATLIFGYLTKIIEQRLCATSELRNAGKSTPCIFTTSPNTLTRDKAALLAVATTTKKPFELKELHLRVQKFAKTYLRAQ